MADTRGPEPRRPVTSDSGFMPVWGWVTLAIAVVVVFGLIFLWNGDATQQTAQSPASPPATSTTPPAKSPATPAPPSGEDDQWRPPPPPRP